MKKGIIRKIKGVENQRGQMFPFLVIVIIFMLIAVMAFVNTSQVNLHKVGTMNAADSGAMAAGTQLATTANEMAWMNFQLMIWFGIITLEFRVPLYHRLAFVTGRFMEYREHAHSTIEAFQGLCVSGYKGMQQAGGSALFSAFSNAPVDEPQRRHRESDGSFEARQSGMSRYLKVLQWTNTIYQDASETDLSRTYSWNPYSYNLTTKQQQRVGGPLGIGGESLTVHIKKSDGALTPWPLFASPLITKFGWTAILNPCVNFECWSSPCGLYFGLVEYPAAIGQQLLSLWMRFDIFTKMTSGKMYDFLKDWGVDKATNILDITAMVMLISPLCWGDYEPWPIRPQTEDMILFCGVIYEWPLWPLCLGIPLVDPWCWIPPINAYNEDICFFLWPFPMMLWLDPNEAEVEVNVSRFSPERNLGLFKFKNQIVSSSSTGQMTGGTIFIPGHYKIKVKDVR